MDPIEQAILYIEDYHCPGTGKILAKTPGVRPMDEEELVGWAFDFEGEFSGEAERKAFLSQQATERNGPYLYFHPLPSGCHALCRISPLRNEGGDSIGMVSHCLIITPRLLRAFHNNVLSLYQSLTARSDFGFLAAERFDDVAAFSPSPIHVGVRHSPVVETDLLEALRDYPGTTFFAYLVSSAINSVCTIFTWLTPSIQLINGVIQSLPVALRPELSFATSLHFSSMRPLRLTAVHENSQAARNICRQYAIPFLHIFHLDEHALREKIASQRDWGALIYHLFDGERYDLLQQCMQGRLRYQAFETRSRTPDWYALNRLGKILLDRYDQIGGGFAFPERFPDELFDELFPPNNSPPNEPALPDEHAETDGPIVRGDFSHAPFLRNVEPAEPEAPEPSFPGGPVGDEVFDEIQKRIMQPLLTDASAEGKPGSTSRKRLTQRFPQFERELRQLDSLVARSLFGDQLAQESLEETWRQLLKRLSFEQAGVIRETYIRLVQSVIVQPRDPEFPKPARRTIDSLEVLNVFLRE